MRRIHVIEDLCNGCCLCQTFCSSLEEGVFGETGRIHIAKLPGEEWNSPQVDCNGHCLRTVYGEDTPTCVAVCPTGALFYADLEEAALLLQDLDEARRSHSLFKIIAPWKWPFPWNKREMDQIEGGSNSQERRA